MSHCSGLSIIGWALGWGPPQPGTIFVWSAPLPLRFHSPSRCHSLRSDWWIFLGWELFRKGLQGWKSRTVEMSPQWDTWLVVPAFYLTSKKTALFQTLASAHRKTPFPSAPDLPEWQSVLLHRREFARESVLTGFPFRFLRPPLAWPWVSCQEFTLPAAVYYPPSAYIWGLQFLSVAAESACPYLRRPFAWP